MNGERVIWTVGLLGAVAAAIGITVAVTSKTSTQNPPSPNPPPPPLPTPPPSPNPPPPPPPPQPPAPGNPTWVPASSIDPGKMYRISVPGDPVTTALITQALVNTNMGPIYVPGSMLPTDWPASDRDPTRWRAQFTNTTNVTIPIPPTAGGVYIFVAQ